MLRTRDYDNLITFIECLNQVDILIGSDKLPGHWQSEVLLMVLTSIVQPIPSAVIRPIRGSAQSGHGNWQSNAEDVPQTSIDRYFPRWGGSEDWTRDAGAASTTLPV